MATFKIPAPTAADDRELAQEWQLAQDALAWREEFYGIPASAPIDRAGMAELKDAYLAMA
jgi:hypothetical protein